MTDGVVNEHADSTKHTPDTPTNLPVIATVGFPFQKQENETRVPKSLDEVISDFGKRRDEHRDFKKAGMVLFDQYLLPGFTPHRSLELLIEGLKLDPERFAPMLDPTSASAVRLGEGFPFLMEDLIRQVEDQTVADIWNIPEVDDFMKIGLQWEIQREDQRKTKDMESSATEQAAKLRKVNEMLRQNPNEDVLMMRDAGIGSIQALIANNGEGMRFVYDEDSGHPYKTIELRGKSALRPRNTSSPIEVADNLIVPFDIRNVFDESPSRDNWEDDVRLFYGVRGREFNPHGNNLPCIAIGAELQGAIKNDPFATGKMYSDLKAARDGE